jgi:hypothetical protein
MLRRLWRRWQMWWARTVWSDARAGIASHNALVSRAYGFATLSEQCFEWGISGAQLSPVMLRQLAFDATGMGKHDLAAALRWAADIREVPDAPQG